MPSTVSSISAPAPRSFSIAPSIAAGSTPSSAAAAALASARGSARLALALRLLEQEAHAGAQAERRIAGDPEALGELVGRGEADAADLLRETIGVGPDQLDRARAIGLEDARGAQGAEAVRVQEQHDVAHRALLAPGGGDPLGKAAADALHLAQPVRAALDDLEHLVAEGLDQLAGQRPADALDHARAEVGLDAFERARRHDAQGLRAELEAEARIGLPAAVGADHLAGRHRRACADHGRRLALVRELDPEHAEAAVGIVEHHPLDEAGEGLRRRLRGGEDERLGGGRRPVMGTRLHGAPNLNPPAGFDKRSLAARQGGRGAQAQREGWGPAAARRWRRRSSQTPSSRPPIMNGIR